MRKVTPYELMAADKLGWPAPPTEFLIDNVLPVGLTVMTGLPDSGRSIMALSIAAALVSGQPWTMRYHMRNHMRFKPQGAAPVALLHFDDLSETRARLRAAESHYGIIRDRLSILQGDLSLNDRTSVDRLIGDLRHPPKPGLVIIDSLDACLGDADEDDPAQMIHVCSGILSIMAGLRCSVLVVHTAKENEPEAMDRNLLFAQAKAVWSIKKTAKTEISMSLERLPPQERWRSNSSLNFNLVKTGTSCVPVFQSETFSDGRKEYVY